MAVKVKTVVIIAGPTAVGKTAVAIDLAKDLQTEIISFDSRQCYRELNIGVARPSESELKAVHHHFIASHSVTEEVNAVTFAAYALEKTKELFREKDQIILVGGTGLYMRAYCEGLDFIPDIDPDIRRRIMESYSVGGTSWLQEQLREKDPLYFASGEIKNPQRMMRALEVVESTGQSILTFRKGMKAERDFNILKTALELPREKLVDQIHIRVDNMIKDGLVEEVRSLTTFQHFNALQTVGYSELFDYLKGSISKEKAVEQIKTNTRQYAKRQMTWFKKDKEMQWFPPSSKTEIIDWVRSNIV